MQSDPSPDIEAEAAELLRKIGWSEYDWKQVELYAKMPPAQKIEQMFRLRRDVMELFEQRLRREHPERARWHRPAGGTRRPSETCAATP